MWQILPLPVGCFIVSALRTSTFLGLQYCRCLFFSASEILIRKSAANVCSNLRRYPRYKNITSLLTSYNSITAAESSVQRRFTFHADETNHGTPVQVRPAWLLEKQLCVSCRVYEFLFRVSPQIRIIQGSQEREGHSPLLIIVLSKKAFTDRTEFSSVCDGAGSCSWWR